MLTISPTHVISLILLNQKVELRCNFTEIFNSFVYQKCEKSQAKGRPHSLTHSLTHLYDALHIAATNLNNLATKCPMQLARVARTHSLTHSLSQ